MKSDWYETTLGTCVRFQNGKKRPVEGGVIPVYGGNGVLDHTNRSNNRNCVIIGRVGAYCGSVFREKGICWVSDNAISATVKSDVDIDYIYYFLKNAGLNRRHIGTSQPLLTQEILNSISIYLPSLPTQKKIAAILSALDEKIELNNKINNNLYEQAKALYRSLFIDYDSCDKSKYYTSELGQIPIGWEVKELRSVTQNIRTKVKDGSYKVLSALNTGILQPSEEYFTKQVYSKDISNYIVVSEHDFAYNPARINIGSVGINNLGYTGCVSPV